MPRTASSPVASLREKSSADLIRAIRSPSDEAFTLDRTRTCLRLFFEPDMLPEDRAAVIDSFGRALASFPRWAVSAAFDAYEKTGTHRPAPAQIVRLAEAELKRITDEVARRERIEEERAAEQRPAVDAGSARAIMDAAGFTPRRIEALRATPMAGTFAEAESRKDAPRAVHWSETADPDSEEWRILRASREANPLIRAAREDAARRAAQEAQDE
ncbi:hypothetical protein EBL87_09065 [Cereibacter sphaeroides]|nr:hypothetical protein EBL87_09065 [Cereibacter sphaeroides]